MGFLKVKAVGVLFDSTSYRVHVARVSICKQLSSLPSSFFQVIFFFIKIDSEYNCLRVKKIK